MEAAVLSSSRGSSRSREPREPGPVGNTHGDDDQRPPSPDEHITNLMATQVTMHDHYTDKKLVVATASSHFVHGKRVLVVEPNEELQRHTRELLNSCGVPEPTFVETGRQCLKSISVSRRNFESSQLSIDPSFKEPIPCANFDFVFLSWDVEEPSCASVLESLMNFGKTVDGDMNSRLQMPTVFVTTSLSPQQMPDVASALTSLGHGKRPRWLNESTYFPLLRHPMERSAVEKGMAEYDYVERKLKNPIAKELLRLPDVVAAAVKATMAESASGTIADHLYSLRRKLRAASARRSRITNSIREIQVAVEAADEAEEVYLETELGDAENGAPKVPYRMQGNRRLYTAKALLRRKLIRLHPKIIHGIRMFWMALDNLKQFPQTNHDAAGDEDAARSPHGISDEGGSIGRDEFIAFNIKIQKVCTRNWDRFCVRVT